MNAEQIARLERFLKTNFVGGTLVEYKDGYGFGYEWGRAKVTKFSVEGTELKIETDGNARLRYYDVNRLRIDEKNGVFLISGRYCACYAIAPPGVEIRKKPTIEEALAASAGLLKEGVGKACETKPTMAAEDGRPTPSELADAFPVLKGLKE
ncbi:MAG: hypothetical protein AB1657_06180 [Candidatus Micrarchaeota archaeon]